MVYTARQPVLRMDAACVAYIISLGAHNRRNLIGIFVVQKGALYPRRTLHTKKIPSSSSTLHIVLASQYTLGLNALRAVVLPVVE